MNIINCSLRDMLHDLVSTSNSTIRLCAPFVKHSTVHELYRLKKDACSVELITNVNLMNFYRNSSDISALRLIQENNGQVYNFQRLHARFYIFDNKCSIISSANLTPSGLNRNFEYGVFVDEAQFVDQICEDYKKICDDSSTGRLNVETISKIEQLLESMPPYDESAILKSVIEYDEPVDNMVEITSNMRGWKRAVFTSLELITAQTFTTADFDIIVPILKNEFPNNNNIEAKIRQQLQELRDLGLIKFEGNGMYKKLWI